MFIGLSEIWTHKDSSSRHLANALLHLWRSVLFYFYLHSYTHCGHQENWTLIKQLEVACFTVKLHALYMLKMGPGRFELPTKELKAPCSTIELYTQYLSELDSNKHRTLPKNGDLPISRSLSAFLSLVIILEIIWLVRRKLPLLLLHYQFLYLIFCGVRVGVLRMNLLCPFRLCQIPESNQNLLFTR